MEVGFPLKLGIPVNSDDFRTTRHETIIVGTSPVILPTYILEKDLTPYIGPKRLLHATTELEKLGKIYGPSQPNTNMPKKFSTLDSSFLLGALKS